LFGFVREHQREVWRVVVVTADETVDAHQAAASSCRKMDSICPRVRSSATMISSVLASSSFAGPEAAAL
jgi:hypothetical protein